MFRFDADSQRLLFQLVGLTFIVAALVSLPGALSFLPHVEQVSLSFFLPLVGRLLQLGVGLWLVLRPALWADVFQRIRRQQQR